MNEQAEAYEVSYGPTEAPLARWVTAEPRLELTTAVMTELASNLPGGSFQVCQVGSYARSQPLLLAVPS